MPFKVIFGWPAKMRGGTADDAMGINTWAGDADIDDQSMVDGDFAVLEGGLQPVVKSLHRAGINILAIHQHMTGEGPRMIFLQLLGNWQGTGPCQDGAHRDRPHLGQVSS